MLAVKYEQSGEVVEAIRWYKKALHLDPDIEQQIYTETRKGKFHLQSWLLIDVRLSN